MNFTAGSESSVLAFVVLLLAVLIAISLSVYRAANITRQKSPKTWLLRSIFGALVWLSLFSAIVHSGFLEVSPMPRLLVFFAVTNLFSLAVGLSPLGGVLASGLPLSALIGFHAFRLPLELILHSWAKSGTIPDTMSWQGANWDIISGLLAIALAPLSSRYRQAAWAFNAVGFALLINVMRVAILSSPLPFSWNLEAPLLIAFHLPYALIVPVCVGGALAGHVVLTRALLRK